MKNRKELLKALSIDFAGTGDESQQHPRALLAEKRLNGSWTILTSGRCPEEEGILERIARRSPQRENVRDLIAEWYLADDVSIAPPQQQAVSENTLDMTWRKYLEHPIIPYDRRTRKEKFSKAYKELKDYIALHEAILASGARGTRKYRDRKP